jgi:hypothetical protein
MSRAQKGHFNRMVKPLMELLPALHYVLFVWSRIDIGFLQRHSDSEVLKAALRKQRNGRLFAIGKFLHLLNEPSVQRGHRNPARDCFGCFAMETI